MSGFRKFIGGAFMPALCVCGVLYFGWHAFNGRYGYRTLAERQIEAASLQAELAGLKARRAQLERRADLLTSGRISPDMLDARARAVLGYANPHDLVLSRKEWERLLHEAPSAPKHESATPRGA